MALFLQGIGIEVSDSHIHLARVAKNGTPEELIEFTLKSPYISDDLVVNSESLQALFVKILGKTSFADSDFRSVLLMPESRVFTINLTIPRLKNTERQAELVRLAQERIPLPLKKSTISIRTIQKNRSEEEVEMVLAETEAINGFKKAFSTTTSPVQIIEPSGAALHRLLKTHASSPLELKNGEVYILVDLGLHWINVSVYNDSEAQLFTRSLAIHFDAEMQKMSAEKRYEKRLIEALSNIILYLEKDDWLTKYIILTGQETVSDVLLRECKKRFPEIDLSLLSDKVEVKGVSKAKIAKFGKVIGAALRATNSRTYSKDHNFIL